MSPRDRTPVTPDKPLRLFVAVDIPEAVKSEVEAATAGHRSRVKPARWTHREGWHVTLKFLGSTWPRLLDEVRVAVAAVAAGAEAFGTRVTEIGVFPSSRRAQVIWAGMEDPAGRFAAMSKGLDDRLEEYFVPEIRAFTPHLTLARLAPPRHLDEFDPDLVGTRVDSEPFAVDDLVLYRSRLSSGGARYEALERFPLSGAPGA